MSVLTEAEKIAYANDRWEAMRAPEAWDKLLTEHLPTDVVRQDLHLWIANTTMPDDPREGALQVAYTVGDRDGLGLSPDEAEYVMATLLAAARNVWRRYGDERVIPGIV